MAGQSELVDWEADATRWIAWARKPGHDSYWYYRDAFFGDIVPEPRERTLDLACGEGRVSRDLAERGHRVTGVDGSPTLVRAARDADRSGRYVVGSWVKSGEGTQHPVLWDAGKETDLDVPLAAPGLADVTGQGTVLGDGAGPDGHPAGGGEGAPAGRAAGSVDHASHDARRRVRRTRR